MEYRAGLRVQHKAYTWTTGGALVRETDMLKGTSVTPERDHTGRLTGTDYGSVKTSRHYDVLGRLIGYDVQDLTGKSGSSTMRLTLDALGRETKTSVHGPGARNLSDTGVATERITMPQPGAECDRALPL